MKTKKIKLNLGMKLMILMLVTILSSILTIVLTSYFISKKSLTELSEQNLNNTKELAYNQLKTATEASIHNYLRSCAEKNKDIVRYFYNQYKSGLINEDEAKKEAEKVILSQKIGASGYIYCVNSSGIIKVHPKEDLINTDLSKYEFIQEQKRVKSGYIEYMWKNPNETEERSKALYMEYFKEWDWIISASSYKEEFYQLVKIDDFEKSFSQIKLGKTGYAYVLDTKGNLLIHPQQKGKNIYDSKDSNGKYFIKEICNNKEGKMIYPWKNPDEKKSRDKIVVYKHIPDFNWIIVSGLYLDELYSSANLLRNILIIVSAIILVILSLFSIIYSRRITKIFKKLINISTKVSDGDFTYSDIEINSNDELEDLSVSFEVIRDKLKSMINEVNKNTADVREFSKKMREDSITTVKVTSEIYDAIDQIAVGNQETAENASNIHISADTAAKSSNETSNYIVDLLESSDKMVQTSKKGEILIGNLTQSIDDTNENVNYINQKMHDLIEQTEKINDISSVIRGIAAQTNLLALNAAIESARSGEAGKGFAVVAEEIRKLSQETNNQANSISTLINIATEIIKTSAEGTKKVYDLFKNQVSMGKEVKNYFIELSENISNEATFLSNINKQSFEVKNQVEKVFSEITSIASIAQENAASSEEVSASVIIVQSMTKALETNSSNLFEMVENLEKECSKFKI